MARARPVEQEGDRHPSFPRRVGQRKVASLRKRDLFPHRYHLAGKDEPMGFECAWQHRIGEVIYNIQLFESESLPDLVGCRESIRFRKTGDEEWMEKRRVWIA